MYNLTMPQRSLILVALFDIKPMTKSGFLDLEKIGKIKKTLNLKVSLPADTQSIQFASVIESPNEKSVPLDQVVDSKILILRELEKAFSEPVDLTAELMRVGGELHGYQKRSKPRFLYRANKTRITDQSQITKIRPQSENSLNLKTKIENFWSISDVGPATNYVWPVVAGNSEGRPTSKKLEQQNVLVSAVNQPTAVISEVEFLLRRFNKKSDLLVHGSVATAKGKITSRLNIFGKSKIALITSILASCLIIVGYWGGVGIKNTVLKSGNQGISNLEQAKSNLANFDFLEAADNFALAYDNFGKASNTLNQLGASFLSGFANIPGLDKVNAADKLATAGQNLSKAGENLALAFGNFSMTNIFANKGLAKLIGEFKTVLISAEGNIISARNLLADIDSSFLPVEKQELFINFKNKIPEFQDYIGEAIDYSSFLLGAVGQTEVKRYLILLENNSELRATGGFPGSYGVVTFEKGQLKEVIVDDIYNIDGQLKENIIPPKPLAHITPNWGMRDANWFFDFPTSARKVEEFYRKEGGVAIDGVMAITPDIIGEILEVMGPIELTNYGITLDAKNFVSLIQNEVEYGANRAQPKTILKDLAPKFFERLAKQDREHWVNIYKILVDAVVQKHLLAYFNSPNLQKVAVTNGLGGEIKNSAGDYLAVIFSNIKGSKTDAMTDSKFKLETSLAYDDKLVHELAIERTHNGGNSKYGFYNRINVDYVRVYAPLGSTLDKIEGNSLPNFRPLIGYADYNFKTDPDLGRIESITSHPFPGVDVYTESDKTVFGFWLTVKPQEKRTVTLAYRSPESLSAGRYQLLWQKQPGTRNIKTDFNFHLPAGRTATGFKEGLELIGDKIIFNSDLLIDREIGFDLN